MSEICPGEKLSEEIFTSDEQYEQTRLEKILIAGNASTLVSARLNSAIEYLTQAVQTDDHEAIIAHLQRRGRCLNRMFSRCCGN